ncbi:hypothetical protein TIFTF001_052067 [Ficus carica]|uniref:Uncharacterized protein n=1 Tax=Ficus carica TaxID=3494 RepID=A0AA88EK66_FICCA|nr:hypothetical protein TIFTF001_052063 [Ficus carica]GMN72766.1 hypothetical protein TIFTF001_052067 [Ficus carica]
MNESGSASEHEEDDQASENDQRNDDVMLAMAVVAVTASRRKRRRALQPMHNSSLTGSQRVEEILNRHEEIIQDLIRMKLDTFRALSNLLDGTGPSSGTQQDLSTRGAMNQIRDMMADDMWDRYQASPWYKST